MFLLVLPTATITKAITVTAMTLAIISIATAMTIVNNHDKSSENSTDNGNHNSNNNKSWDNLSHSNHIDCDTNRSNISSDAFPATRTIL